MAQHCSCSVADTQTVPPWETVGGASSRLVASVIFQNWFSSLQPKFQSVSVYLSVILSTSWVYSLNSLLARACGACPLTVETRFPGSSKIHPLSAGQSGRPHEKALNHFSCPPHSPREAGSIFAVNYVVYLGALLIPADKQWNWIWKRGGKKNEKHGLFPQ